MDIKTKSVEIGFKKAYEYLCWGRDEKANQGREIRATNLPL